MVVGQDRVHDLLVAPVQQRPFAGNALEVDERAGQCQCRHQHRAHQGSDGGGRSSVVDRQVRAVQLLQVRRVLGLLEQLLDGRVHVAPALLVRQRDGLVDEVTEDLVDHQGLEDVRPGHRAVGVADPFGVDDRAGGV